MTIFLKFIFNTTKWVHWLAVLRGRAQPYPYSRCPTNQKDWQKALPPDLQRNWAEGSLSQAWLGFLIEKVFGKRKVFSLTSILSNSFAVSRPRPWKMLWRFFSCRFLCLKDFKEFLVLDCKRIESFRTWRSDVGRPRKQGTVAILWKADVFDNFEDFIAAFINQ